MPPSQNWLMRGVFGSDSPRSPETQTDGLGGSGAAHRGDGRRQDPSRTGTNAGDDGYGETDGHNVTVDTLMAI